MLIKQNKDAFVRFFDDVGYIRDQHSDKDLVYNKTGQVYLRQLSREPKAIADIVTNLQNVFGDNVDAREMEEDFLSFAQRLASEGFVCLGESVEELDKAEKINSNKKSENYPVIEPDLGIVHSSTFLFKHFAKTPHVFNLQIELTSSCNERCIHCYIPIHQRKNPVEDDLSTDDIKKLLLQARKMGTLCVTFSGGELLLRKDLLDLLQFARDCDFITSIYSNVTLLTNPLATRLSELNLSSVQVSLYSMNPDVHDKITGLSGSFEKTKHGIELLLDVGMSVIINCPVLKANKDDVLDVQKFADSMNIKFGSDYLLIGQSDFDTCNLDQRLSVDDIRDVIVGMMENNASYKKFVLSKSVNYDTNERNIEDRPACGVGIDTLNVAANGDIIPCPGWNGYVLGNIKTNSLEEVWLHSEKINYLRSIKMSQFPQCINCDTREYCSMCLLRNFNESNGDIFKVPSTICQVAHLRKDIINNYR